ncbi:hypothetical protein X942_5821 [Burkholderia pseudomallei MSHR5596]|nr:hypothetical protein X942_5821 [Burkholderia pseudomallei MSHR5596]
MRVLNHLGRLDQGVGRNHADKRLATGGSMPACCVQREARLDSTILARAELANHHSIRGEQRPERVERAFDALIDGGAQFRLQEHFDRFHSARLPWSVGVAPHKQPCACDRPGKHVRIRGFRKHRVDVHLYVGSRSTAADPMHADDLEQLQPARAIIVNRHCRTDVGCQKVCVAHREALDRACNCVIAELSRQDDAVRSQVNRQPAGRRQHEMLDPLDLPPVDDACGLQRQHEPSHLRVTRAVGPIDRQV